MDFLFSSAVGVIVFLPSVRVTSFFFFCSFFFFVRLIHSSQQRREFKRDGERRASTMIFRGRGEACLYFLRRSFVRSFALFVYVVVTEEEKC